MPSTIVLYLKQFDIRKIVSEWHVIPSQSCYIVYEICVFIINIHHTKPINVESEAIEEAQINIHDLLIAISETSVLILKKHIDEWP